MKHILNNMSEQEKNSIREQHTGGMKVMTENFNKLINSKLGDSKPLVNEQSYHREEGMLDNEIKINQLESEILPKKGYKAFFNLPDAGKAANFCNKPKMDGCGAWSKGNKIIIVGSEGYCYFNFVPQGQTKNGPFTYDEILNYL